VLVYDTSASEALMALHTLELTARMALAARSAGVELKGLPGEVVSDFLLRSGYRAPRRWPEAGGRA
jgi:ribulose-5-phosphate 4-epimerase/fuculose-1-phosphate aldolase